MPCYHPLTAWKSRDPDDWRNGKVKMVFREDLGWPATRMELPCGQCIGCRLDKARQWAIRCANEAQLHEQNCFLTLTYRPESLPENESLEPEHMQKFLKRLRKSISPKQIRFFQCGEYGDDSSRPHHHCLLFGHDFPDKLLVKRGNYPLYNSTTLDKLWGHGFCTIGEVTFDSACYVARYILKKITGESAEEHYMGRKPEYITMSRRPGIGSDFYKNFGGDIYNHDRLVITDKFLAKPPRFYDRMYEVDDPDRFRLLKIERRKKAKENPDNSCDRLAVKKEIAQLNQKKIPRSYENEETNLFDP